ncbi:MAG: hypothetical protein JWQ38_2547 [Flavipsychrobacter sp.]|nr:hypothetical protein [Flavipsychrobacter sp.]
MKKEINYTLFIALILFSLSCRNKMHATDYVTYINNKEHGLKKISVIDGFEFDFQYKPYDYIILMEQKGSINSTDFIRRKSELAGTAWFTITIKRTDNSVSPMRYGITSIDDYNVRLNYFLNKASKDIKLVYDKISLQPVSYLFENNFNLTPQETIVIGFYLPKGANSPQKSMQLSFNDKIFKTGIINAEFSKEDLKRIPMLAY